MKTLDEGRLTSDLQYRYDFLADFMGFGPEDVKVMQASAPYLGPMIPQLVDQTYARLLSYDATARHFVPRQHGYEGPVPTSTNALSSQHPQIQFRKEHLSRYFMQVLGRAFDGKMVLYLDMVGKMHTPAAGSIEINVPLVQMNALMGVMADIIIEAVANLPLDAATQWRTVRAFSKFLWIQNDFINRHYRGDNAFADRPHRVVAAGA